MRIEKADFRNLKAYRKTKIQALIEEFVAMNTPCVKLILENGEYKDAKSAISSVYQYCKKMRYNNLKAKTIGGEVYIVNTNLIEGI